jgi:hypothetical protein
LDPLPNAEDPLPLPLVAAVESVLRPEEFLLGPGCALRIEAARRDQPRWELFQGQLLSPEQTRRTQAFIRWDLFLDVAPDDSNNGAAGWNCDAPIIVLLYSDTQKRLFVVRTLQVHGWKAAETSPGVIESQPAILARWELVGSVAPPAAATTPEKGRNRDGSRESGLSHRSFANGLRTLLRLACTGISRLPIVSVEAPHPAFSLGNLCAGLGEWPEASDSWRHDAPSSSDPIAAWDHEYALATRHASPLRPWVVEFILRAIPWSKLPALAQHMQPTLDSPQRNVPGSVLPANDVSSVLRSVFYQVSLTPHTDFLAKFVELLRLLPQRSGTTSAVSVAAIFDLCGFFVRQLCRHLNAYDLHRFHSYGANYPDAILIDRLLILMVDWGILHPELLVGSAPATIGRRQALLHAWLTRAGYEGLPIPEHPTTQGENLRIIPGRERLDEGQIVDPGKRDKRLFYGERSADEIVAPLRHRLADAVADLQNPKLYREFGMALFLDRPLGIGKNAGELDRTPLVASTAHSCQIGRSRIEQLRSRGLAPAEIGGATDPGDGRHSAGDFDGIPAVRYPATPRPGVISQSDALKAADDVRWLYTVRSSRRILLEQLLPDATDIAVAEPGLLLRTADLAAARRGLPFLTWFGSDWTIRAQWQFAKSYLAAGNGSSRAPTYEESCGSERLVTTLERVR